MAVGLVGVLALIATTGSCAQVQATPDGRSHTAQYCAPLEESSVDAHRFYCRNGRGGEPAASRARSA
jgi:hypothetical protein